MIQTDNLNITASDPLSPPVAVRKELPLTERAADTVVAGRAAVEGILARRDPRFLMVIGPCSIHNLDGALEYARRLKRLADRVADRIVLVMRVYFEKPRTVLGWKGLIYDPDLNGSCNIERGVRLARKLLLDIAELGLPAGTEILEPVIPQYITDLITWAAIGARTTESQTHRQMASGLSMPIGFKNATDGNVQVAVDAVRAASSPHSFIGITVDGRAGVFRTRGNAFGHLILRGGASGPNYMPEYIAFARELMKRHGLVPSVMVDCSHGNSRKHPERQPQILREVTAHVVEGNDVIIGAMLESYLQFGRQDVADPAAIRPDVSITDPCLGWEETEQAVLETWKALGRRR